VSKAIHGLVTAYCTAMSPPRHTFSLRTPATPQQTRIISIIFIVTIFFNLLLAGWYWGCLCCWSRRGARGRKRGLRVWMARSVV
jgi:hypothetical protein